ncbi:MAG: ankyrin repeat domain-containing protein [Planctomycetota bacterium]
MKNGAIHILVLFLLSLFSSIEVASAQNVADLIAAIESGEAEAVQTLVEDQPDLINGQANFRSPLMVAIQKANIEMINLLLDAGADINGAPENQSTCMCLAVQYGNIDVVKELLKRNPDLNHADRYRQTPVIHALWSGDDILLLLLEAGADVNTVDQSGQSLLTRACSSRRESAALLLIENGADPNKTDNFKSTPLITACQSGGMLNVVEKLLEGGADPTHANEQGFTAIHGAAQSVNQENGLQILELLIEDVEDVNLVSQYSGTPLSLAVTANNSAAVEMLLAKGASVDIVAANWIPHLQFAATSGNARMVDLLIDAGADVNMRDEGTGFTPLHFAASSAPQGVEASGADRDSPNYTAVVRLLTVGGADVKARSLDGATVLQIAINNGAASIADLLIFEVEDPDVDPESVVHRAAQFGMAETMRFITRRAPDALRMPDSSGKTPLVIAAGKGHSRVIDVLLEAGVEADQPDENGNTALAAAIAGQFDAAVDALIEGGADTAVRDQQGRTPLHTAAWYGNEAIVRKLLESGVTQSPTSTGNTPMHAAAWQGHAGIIRLLVDSSDDASSGVNVTDSDGWTPLHKAALRGNEAAVAALLEAGADKSLADAIGMTAGGYANSSGNLTLIETLND